MRKVISFIFLITSLGNISVKVREYCGLTINSKCFAVITLFLKKYTIIFMQNTKNSKEVQGTGIAKEHSQEKLITDLISIVQRQQKELSNCKETILILQDYNKSLEEYLEDRIQTAKLYRELAKIDLDI